MSPEDEAENARLRRRAELLVPVDEQVADVIRPFIEYGVNSDASDLVEEVISALINEGFKVIDPDGHEMEKFKP